MASYVNYPLTRKPRKMGGGGFTPELASAGAGLLSGGISAIEGDTPTAGGSALSGAASGAAAGLALGPIGAGVGAVVGGIAGLIGGQAKAKAAREAKEQALAQKKEADALNKINNSRISLQNFPQSGLQYTPFQMGKGGATPRYGVGGPIPAKPGSPIAQGASFTQNWAKQRAASGFMGMTPDDATGIATPAALTRPQMDAAYNATEGNAILKPGQSIYGVYSPGSDRALVATDMPKADQRSSATHETTHDWQNTMEYNYGTNGSRLLDKAKNSLGMQQSPLRQSYANLTTEVERGGKKPNSYYGNPAEIHARIMEGRAALGLTPDVPVTQQHIEQLKKKNSFLYQQLGNSLDDKGMINGFNKTVMNSPAPTNQVYAAKGGSIQPTYKAEGGEVIEHQPNDVPLTNNRGTTKRLSANTSLIIGDKHSAPSGGIGMANSQPARIFSDQLFIPKNLHLDLLRF